MSEEVNQEQPVLSIEELQIASNGIAFMRATPDYFPCETNGAKIQDYLDQQNWPPTAENMIKAFETLNAAGLMVPRPKSKSRREQEERDAQESAAQKETQRQLAEAEEAELARRRELGSTPQGLKELAKITRAEVYARRKSSPDGIVHTAYPTSKLNAKPRGL